jgi:cytochrome oxidase Cu insertion factor (SCO1/SenC/PrrC family)
MRWRRGAGGPARDDDPSTGAEASPGMAAGQRASGRQATTGGLFRTAILAAAVTVVLVAAVAGLAYLIQRPGRPVAPGQDLRPSGIPPAVPARLANLMSLSAVPAAKAPGFTLTDQQGRTLPLAAFRGKVVVLQFMDPHCTDICPIVSAEYLRAYHELGPLAGKVVFAAINVNQYHATVRDMAAYSRAHQLTAIPDWHFSPGRPGGCRRSGGTTTSRSRHRTPAPTSCTPRRCISSTRRDGSDTSLPRWSATPSPARPTFPQRR